MRVHRPVFTVVGGLMAALCAWIYFNGYVASIAASGLQAPIALPMSVTPELIMLGIM